jgi:hypothetical protein
VRQRRPRKQQRIIESARLPIGTGNVLSGNASIVDLPSLLKITNGFAVAHDRLLGLSCFAVDDALHFPDSTITYHNDGSALVTATIDDLWEARLILLRYGAACQVLAPPELITLFRETMQNMGQIYEI